MSKGSRSRRRRKAAEQARAQGKDPGDELIRLDPGQLCGIAVISPTELPPGLDLDYPGVCALLTEHALIVIPEDQPQIIQPRPHGYALLALTDRSGRQLTAVTTEPDKARRAISMWADASGRCRRPATQRSTDHPPWMTNNTPSASISAGQGYPLVSRRVLTGAPAGPATRPRDRCW